MSIDRKIALWRSTGLEASLNTPVKQKRNHYRVPSAALEFGCFVSELDRPWLDTPFLVQGFLIESADELSKLRSVCDHVYLDLDRSDGEIVQKLIPQFGPPIVELIDKGKARQPTSRITITETEDAVPQKPKPVYEIRSGMEKNVEYSDQAKNRMNAALESLGQGVKLFNPIEFVQRLLKSLGVGKKRTKRVKREFIPLPKEARPKWVPTALELYDYGEFESLEEVLPVAQKAFADINQFTHRIVDDIASGRPPNLENVEDTVDNVVESMIANPDAVLWVAQMRERDLRTYNHGLHVAMYLIALGRQIGFARDELQHLGMIGLLADVGKLQVPKKYLDKPGMLTPAEFDVIKNHVVLGLKTLATGKNLPEPVRQGIAEHHERLDGTGYPKGLKGDAISLWGRMAGLADTFAAITAPRPYADAISPQDALMSLFEWSGRLFPEVLVEQMVQAVGAFPVGTLVELSSGEVGVVISQNRVRRLEPRVVILTDAYKVPVDEPVERDLMNQPSGVTPVRIVRGLPTGAYGLELEDYYLGDLAEAGVQL